MDFILNVKTLLNSLSTIQITDTISPSEKYIDSAQPPLLIRGLQCQSVSNGYLLSEEFTAQIDWVQGIIPLPDIETLNRVVELIKLPSDQIHQTGNETRVGRIWEHWLCTVYGLFISWDAPTLERPGQALIQIKGAYCGFMGQERLYRICQSLAADFSFRPTRLDLALDDHSKSVTPRQCFEAGKAGHFASFRLKPTFVENAQDGGTTTYFGGHQSEKRLRIYDKFAESEGTIDAVRWELVTKDDTARAVLGHFIQIPWEDCPYNFVAQAVIGSIEFCTKPEGNRHLCRYCPLPFWEAFKAKIGQVRVAVARSPQTLTKRIQWVKSAWTRTMAVFSHLCTSQGQYQRLMNLFLEEGKQKLSDQDMNLIKVWKNEFSIAMLT